MKTIVYFALAIIISITSAAGLAGCAKRGQQTIVQNAQDNFDVQFLFEVDGVKVYRFWDQTDAHYIAVDSRNLTVESTVHEGKTSRTEAITTVR